MNYKDLEIKNSYISYGEENIAASFLTPALKCTKLYRRSVGFFSSEVLLTILDGIIELVRNNGHILLSASPKLNEDDVLAINEGYRLKEEIINEAFSRDFLIELEKFDDKNLHLLVDLISHGYLDIKIIVTQKTGMYHDKLGILEDIEGNLIVFYGSPNSSLNGYEKNYEKIRIVKSWLPGSEDVIKDEIDEFDHIWNGSNPYLQVYDYTESAKKAILEVVSKRTGKGDGNNSGIILRDYQIKAIEAWKNNNYHGFYVMATGTGKTWTAIYSAKELLESKDAMIVICAPYKHLIKQWVHDLERAFPSARIIMVSSENPTWEQQLSKEIVYQRYHQEVQLIIVSTIASFSLNRFMKAINKSNAKKLLIVDEAHRLTKRTEALKRMFSYMLGLSATPYGGKSAKSGKELMDFFGGQVFNLPIEDALDRGFLVPYYYYPIYVNATEEEEGKFKYYTQLMISCYRNGVLIDPENFAKYHRSRLRVISMADEKMQDIIPIINRVSADDHFIVYCGDGKLFDSSGAEIKHIQAIKNVLTNMGYKVSQFTAKENMKERMQLIDAFNSQKISTLVAIRCLDEGINIPSIKSALILSSNDNYREFVQRRGRILRTYKGKDCAIIYDVIVLPSHDMESWAAIEFRRFYEYAHLALNWNSGLESELQSYISEYNLNEEDVMAYNYDEMEGDLDE